jgi:hypothetical protein
MWTHKIHLHYPVKSYTSCKEHTEKVIYILSLAFYTFWVFTEEHIKRLPEMILCRVFNSTAVEKPQVCI